MGEAVGETLGAADGFGVGFAVFVGAVVAWQAQPGGWVHVF